MQDMWLKPESVRGLQQLTDFTLAYVPGPSCACTRVEQNADDFPGSEQVRQQLQPLRPYLQREVGDAGEVAPGPAQTVDQSERNRLDAHTEDNGDDRRRRFRGSDGWTAHSRD